jgi:hypothetical protein
MKKICAKKTVGCDLKTGDNAGLEERQDKRVFSMAAKPRADVII